MKEVVIFSDGASSGNPGPAGIGAVILLEDGKITLSEPIGISTNNIAEYRALIRALEVAKEKGVSGVKIFIDSELVVKQINGHYKVKDEKLIPLYHEVYSLLRGFKRFVVEHVPRGKNKEADGLARKAIRSTTKESEKATGRLDINFFREVGSRLMASIPPLRFSSTVKEPLRVGASGDKTYQIDKKAEEIVLESLISLGIPLTVLSEEAGVYDIKGGGDLVTIDPVDGSKNAINGIPLFCTSIAVSVSDRLKDLYTAYIINPLSGDEFWAVKGSGAYHNGKRLSTQGDDIIRVVLYEVRQPKNDIPKIIPLLSISDRTRCFGSIALDLAFVASGAASLYVNPSYSRSFDIAGGVLLVREAGGVITDMEGNGVDEMVLSMKKATSLLASGNERLHNRAVRILNTR